MKTRLPWTETALAGAMAALLGAAPVAAADDSAAKAVKVEEMTQKEKITRSEADAKAHDAADPQELYDPSVAENTDANDDGDLIAEKDFNPSHSKDDLGGNANVDADPGLAVDGSAEGKGGSTD